MMARLTVLFAIVLMLFDGTLFYSGLYHDDGNGAILTLEQQPVNADSVQDTLLSVGEAWSQLSRNAQDASREIHDALQNVRIDNPADQIVKIPEQMQIIIGSINVTELEQWLLSATETGLEDALAELQAIDWRDLPEETMNNTLHYIEEHPYEAAFFVAETVLLFVPGGVWVPVLRALGFTRLGIRGRSIAAFIQSLIGNVPRRSWFARLTSGPMGGYGRAFLDFWARVLIKVGGWTGFLAGRRGDIKLY